MAGIEGFMPKKNNKPDHIPHDAEGIADAKAASDDELNDFIKAEILPALSNDGVNFNTEYGNNERTNWVIVSQEMVTRVYTFADERPKDAIKKVLQWYAEGSQDLHATEVNSQKLDIQAYGMDPKGFKPQGDKKSKLTHGEKKAKLGDALPEITDALNDMLKDD